MPEVVSTTHQTQTPRRWLNKPRGLSRKDALAFTWSSLIAVGDSPGPIRATARISRRATASAVASLMLLCHSTSSTLSRSRNTTTYSHTTTTLALVFD